MLDYVVIGLATWRLSALLSYENGPRDIIRRFRERIGIEHIIPYQKEDEITINAEGGLFADLICCVWCLSVWFAIIIIVCYSLWPGEALLVCSPFAISAVAIIIERIVRG